jgi:tetratricopeptide (TPR) repeat protein
VAAAVANYLAGVQERLQQERLEREKQRVKAAEDRRRHRALAVAAAVVFLTLAGGGVGSTIFALGERRARQTAEEALDFMDDDVLSLADPESEPNRDITQREVLERMTEYFRKGYLKDPESNARLGLALGRIYLHRGEYRSGRDLCEEAHRVAAGRLGETHPTAVAALDQLGKADLLLEDFAGAERVLTRAYNLRRTALGPEDPDTLSSRSKLADLYGERGDLEEAVKVESQVVQGLEALQRRRPLDEDELVLLLDSKNRLGLLYLDKGLAEKGRERCEEAERTAKGQRGWDDCPHTLSYTYSRALACAQLGRLEEAQSLFEKCLPRQQRVLGENHLDTLKTEHGLAGVLASRGRYDEARDRVESILERLGPGIPEDHSFRGLVRVTLGKCFTGVGKYQEAEQALGEAQALLTKKFGAKHKHTLEAEAALKELRDRKADAGPEDP